jgi:hypothetical protein
VAAVLVGLSAAFSCGAPERPEPAPSPCGVAGECAEGLVCDLPSNLCVTSERAECTSPPCRETVAELRAEPLDSLDILVVMDNSPSPMTQEPTLDAFHTFLERLGRRSGGWPSLHLGVISTDVGTGRYSMSGCSGSGDDGALQFARRVPGCEPPPAPYLVDGPDGRNYTAELAEAFRCIARLGIDGCGFEQPLESVQRALDGSQPVNEGFLRDEAALLLLLSIDEDDCSAFDPQLFYTPEDSIDDPLGPLSSYRCFEYGVECAEPDPRAPGPRTSCRSMEDSDYMTPVAEFVAFVRQLKPNPADVAVAAIIGDVAPIEVVITPRGEPALSASCRADFGIAAPGVRLETFVDAFATRSAVGSACGDYDTTMEAIAALAMHTLGSACLTRTIAPERDCVAEVVEPLGQGAQRQRIPACDQAGDERPCYELDVDADECGGFEQALRFSVKWPAGEAPAPRAVLRCMLGG